MSTATELKTTDARALPLYLHLRRLLWWCLMPLALALVVVVAALMYITHQQQSAFAQRRVNDMVAEVDANLARHIQGLKALAAMSVTPNPARTLEQLHADAVAYQKAIGFPVLLTDSDRRIWLSSARTLDEPLPSLPKPSGSSALEAALLSGTPKVGNVVPGPIANQPVIPIVMPVAGLPGSKAWLTSLPIELWQRRLDKEKIAAGWNVVLLDGDGQKIAARGPDFLVGAQASAGGWRFAAAAENAPWKAVVYASTWTFFQPQLRLAAWLLVVLMLVAAASAWAAGRLGQGISRGIARLGQEWQPEDDRLSASNFLRSSRPAGVLREIVITEIEAARQELHERKRAQQAAQEEERRRIARELHDGLQQDLAALKLNLDQLFPPRSSSMPETGSAATQTGAGSAKPDGSVHGADLGDQSRGLIRGVLQELNHIVNGLRPAALDTGGLVPALEQHVAHFQQVTGLQVEFELVGGETATRRWPEAVVNTIYRLTQECLTNVRKHAQATFVHIELDATDPSRAVLKVSDDGVGFEASTTHRPGALGLQSMSERLAAIGGTLRITRGHGSDAAHGTTVQAWIALDAPGSDRQRSDSTPAA